ncbi:MAG: HEAT repeat domain-containing protein [Deltaproteobacteria bacterium]|nr:HEAT repeat domain-containing protein [Deltaproteobacteria bacterium]
MKNRWFYPFLVLLFGLFTAQVISTAQVYLSNGELYRALVTIKDAGYLPIPNERTMPQLQRFGPAFFGGLFFTLTVGAGLSLITLAVVWVWDRLFKRERIVIIPCSLLWLGLLLAVNYRGFSPMVTLYFIFVPLVLVFASLKSMPSRVKKNPWLSQIIHAVPLLILAVLWISQMNEHFFLNLRDRLLLSNSLGVKLTDFYYDFTCYPAHAFETLGQRLIKTCDLDEIQNASMSDALERALLEHDYLNIGRAVIVDLKITEQEATLVFVNKGKAIFRTDRNNFFAKPGPILNEFSSKTDRHSFFRQFTFFSLLFGFPVILYILLYSLFRFLLALLLRPTTAYVAASILCFMAGMSLLALFSFSGGKVTGEENITNALKSENVDDRIAALKTIEREKLEIADYDYRRLLDSPHVPERYWLINSMRVSRRSETLEDLIHFLDDPHSNVISRAYDVLGQRGNERVIHKIFERMERSTDWRNQRYAYNALRNLGWKQSKSR